MSTAIHLASTTEAAILLPLVARCHEELAIDSSEDSRQAAVEPLLQGSPLGAVYLFGPKAAPVGYMAVTFGWSLGTGGMDGQIDELWIRPSVRRRGIGTEVTAEILKALASAGLTAARAAVPEGSGSAARLFERCGFAARSGATVYGRALT